MPSYGGQTAGVQGVEPQFLGGLIALLPTLIPPVIDIVRRLEAEPGAGFAAQSAQGAPSWTATPMSAGGTQGQTTTQTAAQTMDPQFFGSILKLLPEIVPPLLNVVRRLEAPTGGFGPQSVSPMSARQPQQQTMDPQFFGAILKLLPEIVPPLINVVRRLEAPTGGFGPQSTSPMSTGQPQQQTMDPQFFGAILKLLPEIVPPLLNVVRRLEAPTGGFGPQSASPMAASPMSAGQPQQQTMDPQFFGSILKLLPEIVPPLINIVRRLEAEPGGFAQQPTAAGSGAVH